MQYSQVKYLYNVLCLCRARLASKGIIFLTRLFVHYQSCEHNILKRNELILMQIGTSGRRGKGMTLGVRRSKVKVT